MRITRPAMFIEIAHTVAKRSTCARLNVGAIIVHRNRIVSMGYNGVASGVEHCDGRTCPGMHKGECPTIHAERNAIMFDPCHAFERRALYCTDSPCLDCARAIRDARISAVFYGKRHRVGEGVKLLLDAGVSVYQVTPAGFVVDDSTGTTVEVAGWLNY